MSDRRLVILAIDDDPGDVEILRRHLAAIPDVEIELVPAISPDAAKVELARQVFDIVFLDYRLGAVSGLQILEGMRDVGDQRPVVILTGQGDEYTAATLTRAGADEYLIKADINAHTLQSAIERARERYQERLAQAGAARLYKHIAESNIELAQTSRIDPLTQLLNRRAWDESLALDHERSWRHNYAYSVLLLDLDEFKQYNESLGRQAGDECLKKIAQQLASECRDTELLGRYSGVDFVILASDTGAQQAAILAERLRKGTWDLNIPHPASSVADRVTISVGVAEGPVGRWEEVVKRADVALYAAKRAGRNQVTLEKKPECAPANTSTKHCVIMTIDDDPGDAELLRRYLEGIPDFRFELIHHTNYDGARSALLESRVDVTFLDYYLGKETGLDVLKGCRSLGYLGPIIVLTGQGDEQIAAKLIRYGADDYIVKSEISTDVLRRSIDYAEARHQRRESAAKNQRLVAELKAAKNQLEQQNQRLAELYETAHQFVDNVSHEFRTPLTVIREFASIIRDGLAGNVTDDQREYLDIINNRVDDLGVMVEDMLDVSKLEAGSLAVARLECQADNIIKHIRPTLERKAAGSKVSFEIICEEGLPKLYCDPEKIGRVIVNLVVNALKFTDDGGRVELSARKNEDGSGIVIAVSDDGPGISAENVKAIFERFKQVDGNVRASTKGFGLGLNIARELVHLNFGDITVQSEIGQGSTFSFSVPTAEPAKLIERYLNYIEEARNDSWHVSLVRATVGRSLAPSLCDEVDQFLRRQLRSSDLVFRQGTFDWIVIVATERSDVKEMIQRAKKALADLNRSRPGTSLPSVNFTIDTVSRVSEARSDFIESFRTALQDCEPAHA